MYCSENLKKEIKKINKPLLDKYILDIDSIGDGIIPQLVVLLNNISYIDILLLGGGRIPLSKFFELYISSDESTIFCELGAINIDGLANTINSAGIVEPILFNNGTYVSYKGNGHIYSGKTFYVSESIRNRSGKVYYKIYDGDEYINNVEQDVLTKSTKKKYEECKAKKIYYFYLAEAKKAVERDKKNLTTIYSTKLRNFLKASSELEEAKIKDPEIEAERLYQSYLSFDTQFKSFPMVNSVKMLGLNGFELVTNEMFINVEDIDYILENEDDDSIVSKVFKKFGNRIPIGKYKITLDNFIIKYEQLDKGLLECGYEHPHISDGQACLGTFNDIVKDSVSKKDYFQLVLIILDHLEIYNADSPYINITRYIEENEDYYNGLLDDDKVEDDIVFQSEGPIVKGITPDGQLIF